MLLRISFILTILQIENIFKIITAGMKDCISVSCSSERSYSCFYLTLFCLHCISRQVLHEYFRCRNATVPA